MAEIQKQFEEFNEAIRLKQYEHNATLREKRDVVLKKLNERIKAIFKEKDEEPPKYTHFDQGSYKLGTGVKPLTGDFDIDVGLLFEVDRDEYPDPVTVKQWVYDALDGHTKKVEIRRGSLPIFEPTLKSNSRLERWTVHPPRCARREHTPLALRLRSSLVPAPGPQRAGSGFACRCAAHP